MQLFSNLRLTGKIVLPVVLLGTLSVIITLYSMLTLHTVDRDYRALLDREAQASMLINAALLDLSDSYRLVFAVLTEQEAAVMRATQVQLDTQQAQFRDKIAIIRPLLNDSTERLNALEQQERVVFALAATIIDAAARWRGDRALNIIHQQFTPELNALRVNMDTLRDDITQHFQSSSQQLNATTRGALLKTSVAFSLALAAIIGLSAYLSLTQISRPITQLTRTMAKLSQRDYEHPIGFTERQDEVGKMAQALQVFRDTMQRADRLELEAAASAEARRISQQLVDLTDAMPGAVFQLRVTPDGNQQFIFLSGKAEKFIGHDALSNKRSGLLLDDVRSKRTAAADRALAQAIAHSLKTLQPLDIDMQIVRGNSTFWLKTMATAKRVEDGTTLFNGIWLDISEIKAQAHALEEAKEQAEQAARAKAAFLATMSHEIRTPMNAILGLTQLSLRHPLEPRQHERLEKILRAGQHLLGIINDILDFSKIDGGHLQAEKILFSPGQLLEDVREMLEEHAAVKGVTLLVDSAESIPQLIGDPLRISQILLNYTNNALKFSDSGTVKLSLALLTASDGLMYLHGQVEDQGIGLTELQCQSLFQPFQQADASITRRFGGTGLGLAISRSLAELMGGSVGVTSAPDVGSTFWFRVRVDMASDISAAIPACNSLLPASLHNLHGLRLLVVDDNELNRLVARELLREAGIYVDESHNGRHAIELLERAADNTYDAVLMDMMMPELDGLSATRLLRDNSRFNQLPIIAMTANASREDVAQCLAAGMNAHVAKPIDEQRLWQALIEHCLTTQPEARPSIIQEPATTLPSANQTSAPLEHLKRLLPEARFADILGRLIEDYQQRAQQFEALAQQPDLELLQQQAHDLISSAGHAGFKNLVEQARALTRALHAQDMADAKDLARSINTSLLDAVNLLQAHYARDK